MAKKKTPDFQFIRDEPLNAKSTSFYNFYHKSLTPALKKILSAEDVPHTIGIFGSWGTGKSTIIQMLQDDKTLNIPIFVFDAWKYQDDALRRTFLIQFVNFLKVKTDAEIDESILDDLYNSKTESQQLIVVPDKRLPFWKRTRKFANDNGLLILTCLLVILWVILTLGFSQSEIIKKLVTLTSQLSSIAAIVFVADKIFTSFLTELTKKLLKKAEEKNSTYSTVHKDKLNSPEEFEEKFKAILDRVSGKVIVVFDNIDRVQGDVAVAMMSTIKTYMEPNNKSQIIFIIPCDPEAIEVQITKLYESTNGPKTTASDYLRKIFNLILWLPDYIPSDLEEYTLRSLKRTGALSNLLATNDVVLVINAAYSKNPREIIQFINNLVAVVLAAQQSKVADLILANVPYLAKVQVLKQKFPLAYKRLQQQWNTPEEIYDKSDNDESSLRNFLLLTSRITVDDVEPFIFFKNPLETRGLKEPSEFVIALANGDAEHLVNLVAKETKKDAIINFTTDLMNKYQGITPTLLKVYNTQFNGVYQAVPEEMKKKYYNFLANIVDTHLWVNYQKIDVSNTFTLMKEASLSSRQQQVLVTRYVGEVNTAAASKEYNVDFLGQVLGNIASSLFLLSAAQKQSVRTALENSSLVRDVGLPLYTDRKTQDELVSEAALLLYFKSVDEGVSQRVQVINRYEGYIVEGSLFVDLIDSFANAFESQYSASPDNFMELSAYADALNELVKTFRDNFDNTSVHINLTRISNLLINCTNNFTEGAEKNKFLISLRWITRYLDESARQPAINHVGSLLTGFPIVDFASFFDYWDASTKNKFIDRYKDFIYRRVLSEVEILRYVYGISDKDHKLKLLSYVISNTPISQLYDAEFINNVDSMSIKDEIIELIIQRVQEMNASKKGYNQYIVNNIGKNSSKELREKVIGHVRFMINQEDEVNIGAGIELLGQSSFLYESDKNPLANNLIEFINNRGTPMLRVQIELIRLMLELFPNSKGALIKTIFSHLSNMTDATMIDTAYSLLSSQSVTYKTNKLDMVELRDRILIMAEATKQIHIHDILLLRSSRQTKEEKNFWESLGISQ